VNLFLITFFLIYGAVHCYAFLKVRSALHPGTSASIIILATMLILTFAPFIIYLTEQRGYDLFARIFSFIGYIWMGVLFLFFVSSLSLDIFRLFVYLIDLIPRGNLSFLKLSARLSFFTALLIALSISLLGYLEALNIKTEKITLKTTKLPAHIKRLKIVQLSDVHIGLIVRERRLHKILEKVKKEGPDLLVSTGDLVDGQINDLAGIAELFHEINPSFGKYAITGNHEFYAGLSQALDFTKKSGFTILRGEGLTVKNIINIAGVDDQAGNIYGLARKISETDLLSSFQNGKFTLFLKHRPFLDRKSFDLFDLQLSGHTHKGQIFPFNFITKLYYPKHSGFLKLSDHSSLYVSKGTGTWGPPIRFLSPPEITVIEVVNEAG
jgi:predicted MPP superfamily phosphohydrolase